MRDYLAVVKAKPADLLQYGIKGQRWGVRRSSSQLRSAATSRGDGPAKKTEGGSTAKASSGASSGAPTRPPGNIQDNVESSASRYSRLQAEAKTGGASTMTDADLKFFNARTEALTKVQKLVEEKPSWLRETTGKVIQQSAQRQMQTLSDTLADKFIGDPLKAALKTTESAKPLDVRAQDAAKKQIDTEDLSKRTKELVDKFRATQK